MTTHYPTHLGPPEIAGPARPPVSPAARPVVAPGSWRYTCVRRRSRTMVVTATVLSIALHAGILLGFGPAKKKAPKPEERPAIALTFIIPQVKELEELDPVPNDDAGKPEDNSMPVPMQADIPQLPQPTDFVQQLDFASLLEQPDFSQMKNLLVIPEQIRRGSKMLADIGAIFNLADLDRAPEPIVQQAPVYPAAMKRFAADGSVTVEFIVDTQGRVLNPFAYESTDRGFDEAAVLGVKKWTFRPGMRGGRKVNTRMRVPIVFTYTTKG